MIELIELTIEGFASIIKPITYRLNKPGLNKIEGVNGVGKTTIANALSWVGWGQLVKPKKSSINPWPNIIDNNYKGTKVSLTFYNSKTKDTFELIRCNEYKPKVLGKSGKNRLVVIKNNVEVNGEGLRNKIDYQKYIISEIGYSFDLFKSSVLFPQELDKLMDEDGGKRKKIFDEAFETMFVNTAKKKVEERINVKLIDCNKLSNTIEVITQKEKGVIALIKSNSDNINNFNTIKNRQLKEYKTKIKETKSTIALLEEELPKSIKFWNKHKTAIHNLEMATNTEFKLQLQLIIKLEKSEKTKKEYTILLDKFMNINKICEVCKQPLEKKHIIEIKQKLLKDCKLKKAELLPLIVIYNNAKIEHEQSKRDVVIMNSRVRKITKSNFKSVELLKALIIQNTSQLKDLKIGFKNIKRDKLLDDKGPQLETELIEIIEKLSQLNLSKIKIDKELILDKWLIKDPLSNSGLKAFIFNSMMGKLNNHLKEYTPTIGFDVKVFVDMDSANKDIRISIVRKGDEVPYEDLSGGQKQLVNVVIAFALSDTVQSIKPINILFLDELFESLSSDNVEKIGNIIIKKSQTKSIHIISHLTAFSPSNCRTTYLSLNKLGQTIISSSN